mmetsp:Transcript_16195/g.15586  ORF Transcript_16195/g.15586 Transcript_16195/m.15586 type:complete len:92 (+) Transcript_16195:646-921(+)
MYCKDQEETKILWILVLVCIAFAYFMVVLFLVICFGICCYSLVMGQRAMRQENPVVARVPYLNAVQNLRKKNYNDVDDKYMDSCAICLMDF